MRLFATGLIIAIIAILVIAGLALSTTGDVARDAQSQQAQTSRDYANLVDRLAHLSDGYKEIAIAAIEADKPLVPWWAAMAVVILLGVGGFFAWREVQLSRERQLYLLREIAKLQQLGDGAYRIEIELEQMAIEAQRAVSYTRVRGKTPW